jgi:hypothetical protein
MEYLGLKIRISFGVTVHVPPRGPGVGPGTYATTPARPNGELPGGKTALLSTFVDVNPLEPKLKLTSQSRTWPGKTVFRVWPVAPQAIPPANRGTL